MLALFSGCEVRSCAPECLSSSKLSLRELPVELARGVFAEMFIELLVLLLLPLVVSLVPHVGTSVEHSPRFDLRRCVGAHGCPRISAFPLRWLLPREQCGHGL